MIDRDRSAKTSVRTCSVHVSVRKKARMNYLQIAIAWEQQQGRIGEQSHKSFHSNQQTAQVSDYPLLSSIILKAPQYQES